jgi:plastocyanin
VDGDINGKVNPALHAKPGERIRVILVNSGEGDHDIVFTFPDKKIQSDMISKKGETTSFTFTVPEMDAAVDYYDSSHKGLGMQGVLLVGAASELVEGAIQGEEVKVPG